MEKKTSKSKVRKVSKKQILQLKIELQDTNPLVWRRVIVADDLSLWQLHEILQVAMGWLNSHLMQFEADGRTFGRPDWDESGENESEDARKYKLRQVLSEPGDKMTYDYDFGDSWTHDILLEEIFGEEEARYRGPRCVAGQSAAPPEDCGGTYGFENLKRVISDPKDKDHKEMIDWLDFYYPNYDPNEFSLSGVNKILNLGADKYFEVMSTLHESA